MEGGYQARLWPATAEGQKICFKWYVLPLFCLSCCLCTWALCFLFIYLTRYVFTVFLTYIFIGAYTKLSNIMFNPQLLLLFYSINYIFYCTISSAFFSTTSSTEITLK